MPKLKNQPPKYCKMNKYAVVYCKRLFENKVLEKYGFGVPRFLEFA